MATVLHLLIFIASLFHTLNAAPQQQVPNIIFPGKGEFVTLQTFMKTLLDPKSPTAVPRGLPVLLRASFHDLMNFDPAAGVGGAHGCLMEDPVIRQNSSNAGLDATVEFINRIRTHPQFKNIAFSTGDIISLGGKTAVEIALAGVTVPWEFGRPSCQFFAAEIVNGPSPSIRTLGQIQPFLNRYGISAMEMAILTTGAHGIANAQNNVRDTGIPSFTFAQVNSGADFIRMILNQVGWQLFRVSNGNSFYRLRGTTNIGRLESDMMFFPSIVAATGGIPDWSFQLIEKALADFTAKPNNEFDQAFIAVYAKVLRIGTSNLTPF